MKGTDLEASTFQKRPCYRYIRKADKMPSTEELREDENLVALVKLFNPAGSGTWFIAGYDPDTRRAYGRAVLQESEVGFIDMAELVDFRSSFYGLPIERDLWFTPKPLSECGGSI